MRYGDHRRRIFDTLGSGWNSCRGYHDRTRWLWLNKHYWEQILGLESQYVAFWSGRQNNRTDDRRQKGAATGEKIGNWVEVGYGAATLLIDPESSIKAGRVLINNFNSLKEIKTAKDLVDATGTITGVEGTVVQAYGNLSQ